jgi:sarcosine oxidase
VLDLIVVGTGVMGAAAARHAAISGASVLAIGEPEPVSPESHHGLFGAWHDISRLSWRLHSNPADTELTLRSLNAISALEAGGASQILTETGFLNLAAPYLDEGLRAASLSAQPVSTTPLDQAELRTQFPFLSVPREVTAYTEGPPSGHINVRRLVKSQQAAAVAAGAELIAGTVVGVAASSGGVTVAMLDGRIHKASRVLLATGAFSNTTAFLPRPLAFRLKTETVLLAELDPNEAKALTGMPAIHYQIDSPVLSSIYMVPPLAHASGKILLKFGANTRFDTHLSTADEIGAWYRNGPSDQAITDLRSEFEPMFPELEVADWHTSRCVITFTPHGHPFIDTVVPGRLYVATGGNGHSAKWSDGLGGLAASLALNNEWTDPIDPRMFTAQFADEDHAWAGRPLVADSLT